jgi:hypothetical protein
MKRLLLEIIKLVIITKSIIRECLILIIRMFFKNQFRVYWDQNFKKTLPLKEENYIKLENL